MNITDSDMTLLNSILCLSRPLVNIFSLLRILKDDGLSILTKSLVYFYYRVFKDKDMFEYIRSLSLNNDPLSLPWNSPNTDKELWNNPFLDLSRPVEELEKENVIWRQLLTKWHSLFFKNPYFYLKWTEEDGYGYYCIAKIDDIRVVLQDPVFLHSTFLESITEVDKEILSAFGFCSFFEYVSSDERKISPWSLLSGFLTMCNSSKSIKSDCPIYFEHVYQYDNDEIDCVIGSPYRTIVSTTYDEFSVEVNQIIYKL